MTRNDTNQASVRKWSSREQERRVGLRTRVDIVTFLWQEHLQELHKFGALHVHAGYIGEFCARIIIG